MRTHRGAVCSVTFALLLLSSNAAASPGLDADAGAGIASCKSADIYAAIIDWVLKQKSGPDGEMIVVQRETTPVVFPDERELPLGNEFDSRLLKRLKTENEKPGAIENCLTNFAKVALVSTTTLSSFGDLGFWRSFYAHYPKSRGLLKFSKPVFSRDGKTALMQVDHFFNIAGLEGFLLQLELTAQGWRVSKDVMVVEG